MAWYNQHLKDTNLGYWQHVWFAGKMTLWVGWIFFTSAVHAVLPFCFPFWAEREILKITDAIKERQADR